MAASVRLTVYDAVGGASCFSSANPLDNLAVALHFLAFTEQAWQMIRLQAPLSTTTGQWLDGLLLNPRFKDEVLPP
jgi:hypothetical protein